MSVSVKAGDLQILGQVQEQQSETSPFTGKPLQQWRITFIADATDQEKLTEAIQQPAFISHENGEELPQPRPITIQQIEFRYSTNLRHQTYTWLLKETETLDLETLIVGDLVFHPYRYEESMDKDALIITARVEADKSVRASLRKLPQYFPVVRKGVSDEPRSMRRGQILWSVLGDDKVKMQLTLVEEKYDQPSSKPLRLLFEPQFRNVKEVLAISGDRFSQLVDLLESKQLITKEEADGLFEEREEKMIERLETFDCVDDLDKWLDGEEA